MLNPELEATFDAPSGVCLFQLELEKIPAYDALQYRPLSRYPAVRRDLSMTVAETVDAADLLACIMKDKPEVLQNTFLFDMYTGENIEAGQKSVALGLILQDFSRTLVDEDVENLVENVLAQLKENYNAVLRES